jgi:hypothetical protein
VILVPLALFTVRLFEVRREGLLRYSTVANRVTRKFDAKWVANPESSSEMVGTQDPSSLIDYIGSYDVIQATHIVPFSRRAVIFITLHAAAPFALVWLCYTPLDKLVVEIVKRLLG